MTKSQDIERMLIKVSEEKRISAYPSRVDAVMTVRRAFVGHSIIEFPGWLSELWLLDGHWSEKSGKVQSADDFIAELESLRNLIVEARA